MEFKNIDAVKKHYFPKAYVKEQWDNMTPEQKGKHMAEETIESIKRFIGVGYKIVQ